MPNKPLAAMTSASTLIAAQLIGASFGPGTDPETDRWYQDLEKSSLTPPGPVFGVVWTALDALLGYTGYRLMTAQPSRPRSAGLTLWALSVLGVAAHPWTMFRRRRLDEATAVTAGMVASSAGLVAAAANVDRRAAWAAAPLLGWVAFAMYLQAEIWQRNRGR